MIILNLILFILFLGVLLKCTQYAIRYSSRFARDLKIPEFLVSFLIIALISVLPEATVSIISAFKGEPGLGFGTLLGSNVADLTLVLGIVTMFSKKDLKVKSKILKNNLFYLILLVLPLILGLDGKFSRIDGVIFIIGGIIFFERIYRESKRSKKELRGPKEKTIIKNLLGLILSLAFLLICAYLTVKFATNFAYEIKVPAILIGITILSIGTCLPELVFSINAVKRNHDSLALGDILGTVVTDATIVLGFVALISPFSYNPLNIYLTGGAMFIAAMIVTRFMKSDKTITKIEGTLLILFYIIYIFIEFFINTNFCKV